VPVPNSKHFAIRVKGHLVECLEFQAQVFQDSKIVVAKGTQTAKVAVFVWALIIEDDQEETHEFVMVHTGDVASTLVPLPNGEQAEMHLFHAGMNEELAKLDIPMETSHG
jgi:hypothetical protein